MQVCRTRGHTGASLAKPSVYIASDASCKGYGCYVLNSHPVSFSFQQKLDSNEVLLPLLQDKTSISPAPVSQADEVSGLILFRPRLAHACQQRC